MAFPTIPTAAAGRRLTAATTTASTTHTFPNLSSLVKSSGDLLLAVCVTYDGNTTDAEFSGWGASFVECVDKATATTMGIGAAWKISTGSETGTFTVTTSGAAHSQQFLVAIPGAHATSAPESGGYATGVNAAPNPGAANPSWGAEDNLWIAVGGSGEDATAGSFTAITAAPASYSELHATTISADVVGGVCAALAYRQLNAATETPGAFTGDTSSVRHAALTIVVRPPTDPNATVTPGVIAAVTTVPAVTATGGGSGTPPITPIMPPMIPS